MKLENSDLVFSGRTTGCTTTDISINFTPISNIVLNLITRMHSSRMRTAHFSGSLYWWVCLWVQGGVCLWVHGMSASGLEDVYHTHPRHTPPSPHPCFTTPFHPTSPFTTHTLHHNPLPLMNRMTDRQV